MMQNKVESYFYGCDDFDKAELNKYVGKSHEW